jgi:guanine deaminase
MENTKQHEEDEQFIRHAIALGGVGMASGCGGPFGAVIVRNGRIIGEGFNRVLADNDPTAHAEVVAIRNACRSIGRFQLDGCILYASCEPCPMCLGAIYWARPDRLVFAAGRLDAAQLGFDDAHIYEELALPIAGRRIPTAQLLSHEAVHMMRAWAEKPNRTMY